MQRTFLDRKRKKQAFKSGSEQIKGSYHLQKKNKLTKGTSIMYEFQIIKLRKGLQ